MRTVREEERAAEGEVEAAAVIAAGVIPDEYDGRSMIMDVTLAVTRRLSEDQLQKTQEFFLWWIKREESLLMEKLAHKRQFNILLRGNRGPISNSTGTTGSIKKAENSPMIINSKKLPEIGN